MYAPPIKVGIIGIGRISDLHAIEYINNPLTAISLLCDLDVERAREKAKSWGIPDVQITDDMDQFMQNSNIDLVEILLPHDLHFMAASKAMKAGKAVSLQKPMCGTLEEADRLVELTDGYDRQFKIFENFLFYPPVVKARELVDQGAIGRPLSIRIKSNAGYSATEWEVPRGAMEWRQKINRSGGGPLVFDDGHHKFAIAWHFMGNPKSVHSFIGQVRREDGFIFDAQSMISFQFPGNRVGNLEVVYSPQLKIDTIYYAQDDRVEITGEKGVIWINGGHGRLANTPPVICYNHEGFEEFDEIPTGWEHSFILSTRDYIHKLIHGGRPVLTPREAREVLGFAMAAEESSKVGKVIHL